MAILEMEQLLAEVSQDSPCGKDLEYDQRFFDLDESAKGKPAQQMGDAVIAGKEPDWQSVKQQSIALLKESKDIRLSIYLIKALLRIHHLVGFGTGIAFMRMLLEKYWDDIHPQDPGNKDDPTMRVNNLEVLSDPLLLKAIRIAPLASMKGLGSCSLREIAIATGEISAPADLAGDPPTKELISAIFAGCKEDEQTANELKATTHMVVQTIENLTAIESFVNQKVDAVHAFSLAELTKLLKQMDKVLKEYVGLPSVDSTSITGSGTRPDDQNFNAGNQEGQPMNNRQSGIAAIPGEINSRQEVILAMDKVCAYYARYEPSSPIPLLIERSKRLVSMDFYEIVRELAPGGLKEIETIRGGKEESKKK